MPMACMNVSADEKTAAGLYGNLCRLSFPKHLLACPTGQFLVYSGSKHREPIIMTISKRVLLAAAALLAFSIPASAANMIGNCEVTGQKGSIPIATPAKAGQLTVEVSLPAPIW